MSGSEECAELERHGILIIPLSPTRLIFELTIFVILVTIGAAMLIAISFTNNPDAPLPLSISGLLLITMSGFATLATHRKLTQGIRLALTPQELRIENKNGGIIDRAEWSDIEEISLQRFARNQEILMCQLTPVGIERHENFLNSHPPARQQFLIISYRKVGDGIIIFPNGFTLSRDDLRDLLQECHRRYR